MSGRQRSWLRTVWSCGLVAVVLGSLGSQPAEGASDDFSEFEVRVIRPRYFQKAGRIELAARGGSVMNQTFNYTFLGSLGVALHFSEFWGLELSHARGRSVLKPETTVLDDSFGIKTQILETEQVNLARLMWTPMYGKYQLTDGSLVYFDTLLSFGAGASGIRYRYDHCDAALRRSSIVQVYPTVGLGAGQRYFLDKSSAFRWDIFTALYQADSSRAQCSSDSKVANQKLQQNNINVELGYSHFW